MATDKDLVIPTTLRVKLEDGQIVQMSVDEYLKGVVPTEMGLKKPIEALKAQAIASRSYAVTTRRHAAEGYDVCVTTHCQVYRPKNRYADSDRAVDETSGQVLSHQGSIVSAPYFGHCDGHTRNSEDVWSGRVAYLRSVPCVCGYKNMYGHGVGMCQRGAAAMALQGAAAQEILEHYYQGAKVISASTVARTQFKRSIILGTTVDRAGVPVPNVPLRLDGPTGPFQRRSNAKGQFWISGLPAGTWELQVVDKPVKLSNLITDGRNSLNLQVMVTGLPALTVQVLPLAHPREIAGTLGYGGIPVHVVDPAGHEQMLLSGSQDLYDPGGFAVPADKGGLYTVKILDQTFELNLKSNGLWARFDAPPEKS